jgi:menaquinone-dependent protoporphyrinogen IX oxidase
MKVLVTVASKHGATAEIATAIGEALRPGTLSFAWETNSGPGLR